MKDAFRHLPYEFLRKLKEIYPLHYNQIINTFLHKKIVSFRINYLKVGLSNLRKLLLKEKVKFKELSFPTGAFLLKYPLREFQKTNIYQQGLVYIQNVSSMLPVLALLPKNNEKILDLCASPGAKTTQIASLAPQAQIIAIEKIRTRYYKLLANLKLQGADKIKVYLSDGIGVRKKFPEYFDKILVDAPCSAEARFWINNPRSFKYWKERKVREMVHKQKKLLSASFFALREGGILVYSTCTFSPEENEGVVNWLINKFKERIEVLPLALPLKNILPGLKKWKGKIYSSSLFLTRRILPNEFMEGFFIAKLKKKAS